MQFFHIFMLAYTLNGYPVESKLYLQNSEQCQVAIRANERLVQILGADAYLFCNIRKFFKVNCS